MAGVWKTISPLPTVASGTFRSDTMLLLTDGSVLLHNAYGKEWLRLTPDFNGRYETGSWSTELDMTNTREFFASGVLRDGRVFAIGRLGRRAGYAARRDLRSANQSMECNQQTRKFRLCAGRLQWLRTRGRARPAGWCHPEWAAARLVQAHRHLGSAYQHVDGGRVEIWGAPQN
jgi:hypothetical protein